MDLQAAFIIALGTAARSSFRRLSGGVAMFSTARV
jgi:hypothetical protein